MPDFSLYTRMRQHGTLAETPQDIPDARFALPSTINWMRALAILVKEVDLSSSTAVRAYGAVQRRSMPDRDLNTVCEQMLFTLNQLASLRAIANVENKADVARIGIMAWYYGVYGAASAMVDRFRAFLKALLTISRRCFQVSVQCQPPTFQNASVGSPGTLSLMTWSRNVRSPFHPEMSGAKKAHRLKIKYANADGKR